MQISTCKINPFSSRESGSVKDKLIIGRSLSVFNAWESCATHSSAVLFLPVSSPTQKASHYHSQVTIPKLIKKKSEEI